MVRRKFFGLFERFDLELNLQWSEIWSSMALEVRFMLGVVCCRFLSQVRVLLGRLRASCGMGESFVGVVAWRCASNKGERNVGGLRLRKVWL